MPREIYVTPKPGVIVVDPSAMDDLPAEGRMVEKSSYWTRRANEGAVTITKSAPKPHKSKGDS